MPMPMLRTLIFYLFMTAGWAGAAEYDLVVRNGRIVDGSSNPWFHADVAVKGDRIVAIKRVLPGDATREIDATGLVVAPGFIDMHSHSDWLLLEDGDGQSKIRQGVTTEILGEGYSAAPFQGKHPPDAAGGQAMPGFARLADYFAAVERSGISPNVASYVGLNNVWRCVMGQSFERPTAAELERMKTLVDEAMRDGALGLSSQVMMPPGSLATTDDIVALCQVVARHGGIYSTHIRNEGRGVFESVKEAIEIGERAGVPVDVIHLKIADRQNWGRMNEVVDLIESARARGVDVQANVYPYTRGNNDLVSIIPPWAHEGGTARLLARLKDADQRAKMKRDIRQGLGGEEDAAGKIETKGKATAPGKAILQEWYNHYAAVGGDWGRMLVSADNRYKGLTMDRVMALRATDKPDADATGTDELDLLFDLLIEEGGSVGTVYAHHTEEDMNLALVQPWCSIGSDGSAYAIEGPLRRGNPHPRSFGTFPRVLGVYVRERGLLRLEDAVRKMTSLNAAKVGLRERGMLRVGAFADLAIFDPVKVIDRSTYTEPFQYGAGVEYVVVNGQVVLDVRDAEAGPRHLGTRPGRALRRQAVMSDE
jgi:N-acyl-D-amino-acid deacylase